MKKGIYIFFVALIILTSCKDDDGVFDKTADERVAEAIASLKADLIAPVNGWRIKYTPESGAGSYYVLLKFDNDNRVNIKTDISQNDGEFYDKSISYRIDNSLSLELIFENYSFFSFLFEQNQASFGGEFEFVYVDKIPNGNLIFKSKTDLSTPTTLVFEEASSTDSDLLGIAIANNLNTMSEDIHKFTSSFKITYEAKDLILYTSMDAFTRTISFNSASKKMNTAVTQSIDFSTPYIIKGDSIVFDTPLVGTFLSNAITIKSIKLNNLTDASLTACGNAIPTHAYEGVTSANHAVRFETSLLDVSGRSFVELTDFYGADINYIFNNGISEGSDIAADITGAVSMQLYYNYPLSGQPPLFAIGFALQNKDGSFTFALKKFTATLIDNNLKFEFAPAITLFGNQNPDANTDNIDIYLDQLTEGDNTYVYRYSTDIYEFYNPCSGWSFIFQAGQ